MLQCVECTQLRNIYIDLTIKDRIAITDSTGRAAVYDLKKMRDAKIAAERILEGHELTHNPKAQATERFVVESQEPDRNTSAILLPSVAELGCTL